MFKHNDRDVLIIEADGKNEIEITIDKEGFFVIKVDRVSQVIEVDHYSLSSNLEHTIRGVNAMDIMAVIIENKWVSEMSHVAYLSRELTLAEYSLNNGTDYVQGDA